MNTNIYVCVYEIYMYISSYHNCHTFPAITAHLLINSHIYIFEVIFKYTLSLICN